MSEKIYDFMNEDWYRTPDMGEFMSARMHYNLADESVTDAEDEKKKNPAYYVESPIGLENGYYPEYNVLIVSGTPSYKKSASSRSYQVNSNIIDADTIRFNLSDIVNDQTAFSLNATTQVFKSNVDYLGRTLRIQNDLSEEEAKDLPKHWNEQGFISSTTGLLNYFSVRFVGINAPELPHYSTIDIAHVEPAYVVATLDEILAHGKLGSGFKITENNLRGNKDSEKKKFKGKKVDEVVYSKVDAVPKGTSVTYATKDRKVKRVFVPAISTYEGKSKIVLKEVYAPKGKDGEEFIKAIKNGEPTELVSSLGLFSTIKADETSKFITGREVMIVSVCAGELDDVEYYNDAKTAQQMMIREIDLAEDLKIMLDCNTISGLSGEVPPEYRSEGFKIGDDPMYALEYLWNIFGDKEKAYKHLGYGYFGQDNRRRALGAIYIKRDGQWRNLAKYLAFHVPSIVKMPMFTSSPEDMGQEDYISTAFDLGSYKNDVISYIDLMTKENQKEVDDRKEVQERICGCKFEEMYEHTVMIGDCMLMVPPTSVRLISQTMSTRQQFLRTKGSLTKTMPKTDRSLELNLFFNNDGINGIKDVQETPGGQKMIYHMNGLRALIAQFKFTPFLPIHNHYINNVLNIEAVALVACHVTTVPNYPRTVQVSLTLQEFDYRQYMPQMSTPDQEEGEDLFTNVFSQAIHYPLMRFYYQRCIQAGEELKELSFESDEYLEKTLGAKTSLQPVDFKEPRFDIYVMNENMLRMRKSVIKQLERKPLGSVPKFTTAETEFLKELCSSVRLAVEHFRKNEEHGFLMGSMFAESNLAVTNPKEDMRVRVHTQHLFHGFYDYWYHYNSLTSGTPLPSLYKKHALVYVAEKTRQETYDTWILPLLKSVEEVQTLENFNNDIITSIELASIHTRISGGAFENEDAICKLGLRIKPAWEMSGTSQDEILNKIRLLIAKDEQETTSIYIEDGYLFIYHKASLEGMVNNFLEFTTPFAFESGTGTDMSLINMLAASLGLSTEDGNDTTAPPIITNPDMAVEEVGENIDLETAASIKFDKYPIGNVLITNMSASYSNVFANLSLKAMDGRAPQYTGGSDLMFEVSMITREEEAVRQLQTLNRKLAQQLIDYRKVISNSPIRIDSEMTRLMGVNEIIIESIDINTVPDQPGVYAINMRFLSVDRTIRNKEALQKLENQDHIQQPNDAGKSKIKTFFALDHELAKVDLYPDLELPTIRELETHGFHHLMYKVERERVFPDADFYFVYLEVFAAELYRAAIVKYFDKYNEQVKKTVVSGNLFKDEVVLNPTMNFDANDPSTKSLYTHNIPKDSPDQLKSKAYFEVKQNDEPNSIINVNQNVPNRTRLQAERALECGQATAELSEIMNATMGSSAEIMTNIRIALNERTSFGSATDNILYNANINYWETDENGIAKEYKYGHVKDVMAERNKSLAGLILKILSKPIPESITTIGNNSSFAGQGRDDDDIANLISYIGETCNVKMNKAGDGFDGKSFNQVLGLLVDAIPIAITSEETQDRDNTAEQVTGGGSNDDLAFEYKAVYHVEREGKFYPRIYMSTASQDLQTPNVLAKTEAEKMNARSYGAANIQRLTVKELEHMWNVILYNAEEGFGDPYYNKDLSRLILGKEITDEELLSRKKAYIKGISDISVGPSGQDVYIANRGYLEQAIFRQMLCHLYTMLTSKSGGLISTASIMAADITEEKLDELKGMGKWSDRRSNWFWRFVGDLGIDEEEEVDFDEALDDAENAGNALKAMVEDVKDCLNITKQTLISGMFFLLGGMVVEGSQGTISTSTRAGDLNSLVSYFENINDKSIAFEGMSLADIRMFKYFAEINNELLATGKEIEKRSESISNFGDTPVYQKLWIEAADNPGTWLMHSFYDMVTKNRRGSMARAFPTYYMLLIDEGREFGAWHLQDNFYNISAINEFQVVRSRKIAADTATITMSNLFGTYSTDDTNIKAIQSHTLKDVWDSIFSPRKYVSKEFIRRKEAPTMNRAKLKAGARVHLRMGYSGNASDLPIVFNGTVAEIEEGDTMILQCQGDGVELDNPGMFVSTDAKDTADLKHSDSFWATVTNIFKNLSTPKGILTGPLMSEGGFIRSIVKEYSNSRFFNENPFGLVHFGDIKFKDLFQGGEVEQNIYEAMARPSWAEGVKENLGIVNEYALTEPPRIRMPINSGTTYWQLMHTAASISPGFIASTDNFGVRSTVFFGLPHYYYAYKYEKTSSGKIRERRKPFQQFHVVTSYSDIIDNKMRASEKEVRTVAVGHYKGHGLVMGKDKTVGPLFVDFDIYPENQKSTAVDCGFQYRSVDYVPFTLPIVGYIDDELSSNGGYEIAWRATARALQESMKDMYTGEIIIMGDAVMKPYDIVEIYDSYEDISGSVEIETVVHTFSIDTGFTTSITPDCRASIDNKYETRINETLRDAMGPVMASHIALCSFNATFQKVTKPLMLTATYAAGQIGNAANSMINAIGDIIGQEQIAKFGALAGEKGSVVGQVLGLSSLDYGIDNNIKKIENAFAMLTKEVDVSDAKTFNKALKQYQGLVKQVEELNPSALANNLEEVGKLWDNPSGTKLEAYNNAKQGYNEMVPAYNDASARVKQCNYKKSDITPFLDEIAKVDDLSPAELKALEEARDIMKGGDLLLTNPKSATLADDLALLAKRAPSDDAIKVIMKSIASQTDDIAKTVAVYGTASARFGGLSGIRLAKAFSMTNIATAVVWLVAEVAIMKSAKEYVERKLKNLQVLTVYPVIKNDTTWTAGLTGSKGLIYGHASYEERGFMDKFAEDVLTGDKWYAKVADFFLTTNEMRKTIEGFKRKSGFGPDDEFDSNKAITEMLNSVAMQEVVIAEQFKRLFATKRVSKSSKEDLNNSYHLHRISGYGKISDLVVDDYGLEYVYDDKVLSHLRDKGFAVKYGSSISDKVIDFSRGTDGDKTEMKYDEKNNVWDIPYLKPDAMDVLATIVEMYAKEIQPDYDLQTCDFKKLKEDGIYLTKATMVNSKTWNSTGYQFALQVNNHEVMSNILVELSDKQGKLSAIGTGESEVFTYEKSKTQDNLYTVFVYPKKE